MEPLLDDSSQSTAVKLCGWTDKLGERPDERVGLSLSLQALRTRDPAKAKRIDPRSGGPLSSNLKLCSSPVLVSSVMSLRHADDVQYAIPNHFFLRTCFLRAARHLADSERRPTPNSQILARVLMVPWHPYCSGPALHCRVPSPSDSCHLSKSDRHFFAVVACDKCDLAFRGVAVLPSPCVIGDVVALLVFWRARPLSCVESTTRGKKKTRSLCVRISLVSGQVHGEACVVRGGYHLNSDHWPIDGSLRLERKELWGTTNQDEFSQRGWVPKTDEAKRTFMRGVAKDLCWMDEEAKGKALVS